MAGRTSVHAAWLLVVALALPGCFQVAPAATRIPTIEAASGFPGLSAEAQRERLIARTRKLIELGSLPGAVFTVIEARKVDTIAGQLHLEDGIYGGMPPGTYWAVTVQGRWEAARVDVRRPSMAIVWEAFRASYYYLAATGHGGNLGTSYRGDARAVPTGMLELPPAFPEQMRLLAEFDRTQGIR